MSVAIILNLVPNFLNS